VTQEVKKLKIVVVGVGGSGYRVTELLENNPQTKDLDFIYIDKPYNGIKANSTCKTIALYTYKPCTLEEAKSEFLRWELSLESFERFEPLLQEGDEIFFFHHPGPSCFRLENEGVKIKRNGKFIHTYKFDLTLYNAKKEEEYRERQLEELKKTKSYRFKKMLRCMPKVFIRKVASLFKK
jgi:hypothetical protein